MAGAPAWRAPATEPATRCRARALPFGSARRTAGLAGHRHTHRWTACGTGRRLFPAQAAPIRRTRHPSAQIRARRSPGDRLHTGPALTAPFPGDRLSSCRTLSSMGRRRGAERFRSASRFPQWSPVMGRPFGSDSTAPTALGLWSVTGNNKAIPSDTRQGPFNPCPALAAARMSAWSLVTRVRSGLGPGAAGRSRGSDPGSRGGVMPLRPTGTSSDLGGACRAHPIRKYGIRPCRPTTRPRTSTTGPPRPRCR